MGSGTRPQCLGRWITRITIHLQLQHFYAWILSDGPAGSSESPMALLEQRPRRQFGVDDQPICPQCGNAMHLTGRAPHLDYGGYDERQTFMCYVCRYESQRNADAGGKPCN